MRGPSVSDNGTSGNTVSEKCSRFRKVLMDFRHTAYFLNWHTAYSAYSSIRHSARHTAYFLNLQAFLTNYDKSDCEGIFQLYLKLLELVITFIGIIK